MKYDQAVVREVLESVKASGRTGLSTTEAKRVADAYLIPTPREGLASHSRGRFASFRTHRSDMNPPSSSSVV